MNWSDFSQLIRLPNQAGTLLLMLPTLWALVAASHGHPPLELLLVFAVGSFLMRSLGVVINDMIDRPIDRQVERTKTRPLASGALTIPVALAVATFLAACASTLLLFLNPFVVGLSPVAFLLASVYPLSKRVIHIPQAVLGLAFGWGVVMAWAAVRNALDPPVWLLFAATVCWTLAYDSIYALQDLEDDVRIGVKSSAILFGSWTWLAVILANVLMILCLVLCGILIGVGLGFYLILIGILAFLLRQAWALREPVSRSMAFAMFKQHVWVGAAVLGGFWVGFHN